MQWIDHIWIHTSPFPRANRPANLVEPFLWLIKEVRGCHFSTVKVLWKYYHTETIATRHQSTCAKNIDANTKLTNTSNDAHNIVAKKAIGMSGVMLDHFLCIRNDLTYSNVSTFVVTVDEFYWDGFARHYRTFTYLNNYIVGRNDFLILYVEFMKLFPYVHSVLALMVSSPHRHKKLIPLMQCAEYHQFHWLGVENEAFHNPVIAMTMIPVMTWMMSQITLVMTMMVMPWNQRNKIY